MRQQTLGIDWQADRALGVEAIVNSDRTLRIAYQNVDRACDEHFPPMPRSSKGAAAEELSGPTLFEHAGVEPGPLTGVLSDGIPTYYVMVGEDGSVELSHPVIKDGSYKHFHERIFVRPQGDSSEADTSDTGPVSDFDISVSFKD